jgi:hypothetical protein
LSWEQRLREIVLAGGAIAAAACADNAGTSTDAAHTFGGDACCNGSPDPCCQVLGCGEPMTAACACQMDGGTPNYSVDGSDSVFLGTNSPAVTCSFPGDAGPNDAAADGDGGRPSDALPDIVNTFPDVSFCCNANPDPCCQFLHCGGAMTPQCSVELACQADGGTWSEFVQFADGSVGPSCLPGDAGPGDAGGDGHD